MIELDPARVLIWLLLFFLAGFTVGRIWQHSRYKERIDVLEKLNVALAERCEGQHTALGRKAEKVPVLPADIRTEGGDV